MTAVEAIVIGGSAGSLEALLAILPPLPADFQPPIVVVVHLPPDRESHLAEILGRTCRLPIRQAEDKEPIEPATVYLAPPDYHLLVEPDRRLSLSSEEPVHYSRPSIDVLFETAVEAYGAGLVGIILTGANRDGAVGLRAISQAGGVAIVQRPDQAQSPAMPRAAIAACPEAQSMELGEIAAFLLAIVSG